MPASIGPKRYLDFRGEGACACLPPPSTLQLASSGSIDTAAQVDIDYGSAASERPGSLAGPVRVQGSGDGARAEVHPSKGAPERGAAEPAPTAAAMAAPPPPCCSGGPVRAVRDFCRARLRPGGGGEGAWPKRLYLVRHGQSDAVADNAHYEQHSQDPMDMWDAPLTAVGREQAAALRPAFERAGRVDLAATSPLTRAMETCMLAMPACSGAAARYLVVPEAAEHLEASCDIGRPGSELRRAFPELPLQDPRGCGGTSRRTAAARASPRRARARSSPTGAAGAARRLRAARGRLRGVARGPA
ncbi:unnamed protein product [Prorocentrum cordatum]|uniref:Phosphoglycerate mutase (2,3-diphosphoglycerate-dependent) n=1 Tax=Prorocentrum cordatum TaxID=2364126 RepID=A0ABN9WM19_9DINO|nr:unnamed protein product [Polarella glacialis]